MPWNEARERSASAAARRNARTLRRRLTDAEKRLWWHLRHSLALGASHFRRQVALGLYVVDFCCLSARLIVEVDGNQHGHDSATSYDARRTSDLDRQGFRVLRFSNADVMTRTNVVLDTILAALEAPIPTPTPPVPAELWRLSDVHL